MNCIDLYSGKASYGMVKAILHQLNYGEFTLEPLRKHRQQVGYSVYFMNLTFAGELFLEQLQADAKKDVRSKMNFYHCHTKTMQFWYVEEDTREFETALVIGPF